MWNIICLLLGVAVGVGLTLFLRRDSSQNPQATKMLTDLSQQQTELATRVTVLTEAQEKVSKNVTDNLKESGDKTAKSLNKLGERLVVIDKAQAQITQMSGQMVELQQILDNKQARGAFGETQLADIVRDGLPENAYEFQYTLSNGKRADCLIRLPNPPGPVVVDSKFPLESFQRYRNAENDEEQNAALKQLRTDTLKHAKDIAERYILPGETADAALMFLPSESIFSELHLKLPKVVDECRACRVYPVSPNTMSLTLNTVRAIMRDVKMREQAGVIQKEVGILIEDITRLDKRVGNLRGHFDSANKDIGEIETSARKISSRGEKSTGLELKDDDQPALPDDGD